MSSSWFTVFTGTKMASTNGGGGGNDGDCTSSAWRVRTCPSGVWSGRSTDSITLWSRLTPGRRSTSRSHGKDERLRRDDEFPLWSPTFSTLLRVGIRGEKEVGWLLKSSSPRLRLARELVPTGTLMPKSTSRSQEKIKMNEAYLILGGCHCIYRRGKGSPLSLVESEPLDQLGPI